MKRTMPHSPDAGWRFLAVAVLILAATIVVPGANVKAQPLSQRQPSPTEHNRHIVEAVFQRWTETGEGTGFFDEVLSPDVVWTIKGSGPSAGTFNGREMFVERAVRPFALRMSTPVRPISTRVWADGGHVIVNFDGEGVAIDGAPYGNSYVWILRMRDGKVVEVTAFLDLTPYDDVLQRVPVPVANGDRR